MPVLDPVTNFGIVTVSTGYDNDDTSIALTSGHGARLPQPGVLVNGFNMTWWNSTDYSNPEDDPNVEIVRVTARSTDTLTVTRAQEGTSGSTKNTGGKTYKMILTPSKKLRDDLDTSLVTGWHPYANVVPTRASSDDPVHVLTFAGVDLTSFIQKGSKMKLTQTAGSNTHSLDLELASSQYASKTDAAALSITGAITIEAWVRLESLPGTGQTIVSKWHQDGSVKSYIFYVNSDNETLRVDYSGDGSAESGATSSICLSSSDIGRWMHLAVTVTPSTKEVKFYKNGVLVSTHTATGTQTAIQDNGSTFAIGARDIQGTPDTFFDGLISEVRLWSVVRTQSEISGNMCHNLVGNESNLNGYWKLSNDYNDTTANANHLTSSGSPSFSTTLPGKLTNSTKYGVVTDITFSTDTTLKVFCGTEYAIDDGTISAFNFSNEKSPIGFPLDPDKWTVEISDVAMKTQSTPSASTWYNKGPLNIHIPIGAWRVQLLANLEVYDTSASTPQVRVTLSTANNSESDSGMTGGGHVVLSAATRFGMPVYREKTLVLTSKTTHYVNIMTPTASVDEISLRGDIGKTIVRAICAYL